MSINRFAVNSSHIYDITKVSQLNDGLMFKEDKIKLDGLVNSSLGANVNVTVVSPSTEELTKEFSDIKTQLIEQMNLFNKYETFINSPGQPDGLATLDSSGKLSSDYLPTFKTVNGESVVGDGNIIIRPGTDVDFTPVNNQITDLSSRLKNDYALKTELSDAYDDTALRRDVSALQAINHTQYLTEHQSLENYATKTYVTDEISKIKITDAYDDSALKSRLDALESIDHTQYLTEHQSLKTINNNSLSGTGNLTLADMSDNISSDTTDGITFNQTANTVFNFGSGTKNADLTYNYSLERFVFSKNIYAPNFDSIQTRIISQADYDALTEKDESVVYFIRN